MRRACRRAGSALMIALLLGIAAPARSDELQRDAQTRATMDSIFDALRFVLPLSLDDASFQDPERREEILAALDALAENGAKLDDHGRSRDASFRFLSGSLARDTREIRDRYAEGRVGEARFLLMQLTDDCVACHSRLPSDRAFPRGEEFVTGEQIAALPLDRRATIEMATRQFDRALETHEELFRSPDQSPNSFDLHGHLDDYLEICIRVRGDLKRPIGPFETLLQRDDLSASLRDDLTRWVAALRRLQVARPQGSPLEQADALIASAEAIAPRAGDRGALVEYLLASSILHQELAAAAEPDVELADAYYRLGVIESRIGRSLWLSQTEDLLETAIRLDPGDPRAERAYALLEEFVVSGHTGSSGVHVPDDVRARLDELRTLIDRSAAAPAAAPAQEPGARPR